MIGVKGFVGTFSNRYKCWQLVERSWHKLQVLDVGALEFCGKRYSKSRCGNFEKIGLFIVRIDHRNYPDRGEACVVQGSVKRLCSVVSVAVPVLVKTWLAPNSFNITAMKVTQVNKLLCYVLLFCCDCAYIGIYRESYEY